MKKKGVSHNQLQFSSEFLWMMECARSSVPQRASVVEWTQEKHGIFISVSDNGRLEVQTGCEGTQLAPETQHLCTVGVTPI